MQSYPTRNANTILQEILLMVHGRCGPLRLVTPSILQIFSYSRPILQGLGA